MAKGRNSNEENATKLYKEDGKVWRDLSAGNKRLSWGRENGKM